VNLLVKPLYSRIQAYATMEGLGSIDSNLEHVRLPLTRQLQSKDLLTERLALSKAKQTSTEI